MKNQIIAFIKNIFIFFIFFIFFDVFFIVFFGLVVPKGVNENLDYKTGSNGHLFSRVNEISNYKDIDILFLGSSHTYRGFDPRIFKEKGLTTFNLGSSAQTPIQTKLLLNRYLDKINPKMVIYEVCPNTFSFDGVESALDIISNDKNDMETMKMVFKIKSIKVFNTMIYGFFRDIFNLNKNFSEKNNKGKDTYVTGGFVERKLSFFYSKKGKIEKLKIDFNDKQFEAFNYIIKLLKKKKIEYILVQSPITKALYNSYSNNDFFDAKIKKYGKYYNFNKSMKLSDTLNFYDENHLNQYGVKLFDDFLIKTILHK